MGATALPDVMKSKRNGYPTHFESEGIGGKNRKKAWELSIKAGRVIKPTDVADALLARNLEDITVEEVEKTKAER
jgi:hypothetical protein